jgi:hypothetical protein
MLELNTRQRTVLSDKLFDLANVAIGATVFGQFLSERRFLISIVLWGIGAWLLLGGFAMMLAGRKDT